MNSRHRLTLLVALLLGFALRLYHLGAESLWYDETVSVVLAQKSIPALIAHTAGDIHPPGYYLLLHFWALMVQPTVETGVEFLFAWPSLFFGLLLLPLLFVIAKRLHGTKVALGAMALAAVNPFHLWYSQEVRMYTLGAALGLICLWCLVTYLGSWRHWKRTPSRSVLAGYVLVATVGLYSLYYFAFTLLALNVIAAFWFGSKLVGNKPIGKGNAPVGNGDKHSIQRLKGEHLQRAGGWLVAQLMVLGLWSPWLPVFWQQATDPPVPPWRIEWTLGQFGWDLLESGSALVAGQTMTGWLVPVVAGIGALALLVYGFGEGGGRPTESSQSAEGAAKVVEKRSVDAYSEFGRVAVLLYLLVPIGLIYLLTALVTPLYHVRYLFTYAPVFMIVLATVLAWVAMRSRLAVLVLSSGVIALSGIGLYRFWQAPEYRADDHRGAAVELAQQWRPGDLLLVNAGWAYTALETYWPGQGTPDGRGSYPPQIAATNRLLDFSQAITSSKPLGFPNAGQTPVLVRTGSVDATENLGWGDPKSDFFAITRNETEQALNALAECYKRVWHYRIYDTVNDPTGVIRGWLEAHGTLQNERWISGRDLGQLRLYSLDHKRLSPSVDGSETSTLHNSSEATCGPTFIDWTAVDFGNALRLVQVSVPQVHSSGRMLYATLEWQPLPGLADEPSPLSMSMRLYADVENQVAQQDESPMPGTETWLVGWQDDLDETTAAIRQTLALPISSALTPGSYSLELIVYRQHDGSPLSLPELPNTTWGQRLRLTSINLSTP